MVKKISQYEVKKMFQFIKSLFGLKRAVKDFEKRNQEYLSMTTSELKELPEEELFDAALARTEAKVDKYEDIIDGVNSLTGAERTFYVTSYYEMEVNNGGLCQFFINSSREIAPELVDRLSEIGAVEHKALFESFINENAIDVNDLSSFVIDDVDEFETQAERYPFDDFDNAFFDLAPIQELLVPYLKEHISEF